MTTAKTGQPCDKCGSSDAKAYYEDGGAYCFACPTGDAFTPPPKGEGVPWDDLPDPPEDTVRSSPPLAIGKAENVPSRGLQAATLEYFGVTVLKNEVNGEVNGVSYPVYVKGEHTGSKEKTYGEAGEKSRYIAKGSTKNPQLFGQNTCGSGGKLLIITEGEDDCMAARQLLVSAGKKYNVVSLPTGGNVAAIRNNLEWIETFQNIVLNFDKDKVGSETAIEAAEVITPGKVKLMELPDAKDANEFLMNKRSGMDYLKALWGATSYRPDGVVPLSDSWELMFDSDSQQSIPYPWQGLNDMLYGMREREIVTWTAGSGVGKSALVREIEHHLLKVTTDNIGILALEESVARTAWGIVSVEANLPLSIREERQGVPIEDIKRWYKNTLGTGRLYTLDHFGSTSEANLLNRVRYMIKGLGCKWIVLDHLSIVVSAMEDGGDERKTIDSIMTKLRQMCEETNAGIHLVSHLRRVNGDKGHEQGVEVSLSHLRGSQAIAQLSDSVIAAERDQQALNVKEANLTRLRVLKNRYAGITGLATNLAYIRETGRMQEINNVEEWIAPDVEEAGC